LPAVVNTIEGYGGEEADSIAIDENSTMGEGNMWMKVQLMAKSSGKPGCIEDPRKFLTDKRGKGGIGRRRQGNPTEI
jgi:hypothetical protein